MGRCRHTGWVRPWKSGPDLGLEISDRPRRILEEFRDPNNDCPGLLMLIGNQSKCSAFASLRIQNGKLSSRGNGEVHLFASSFKHRDQSPLLVADADIPRHGRLPLSCRAPQCHEVLGQRFSASKGHQSVPDISDTVFHSALFPFADVVCVFVADIGSIEASVRRLACWLDRGQPSVSPIRPHLIFVVNKEDESRSRGSLQSFMGSIDRTRSEASFQSISTLGIPIHSSRNARHKRNRMRRWEVLHHEVLKCLAQNRQARRRSNYLFSLRYLTGFLHRGASAATCELTKPFDYIITSRLGRAVAPDLSTHLVNFLHRFTSSVTLKRIGIPLIASSLLLDHYTHRMHVFNPHDVFQTLYFDPCSMASCHRNHASMRLILPSELVRLIEESMVTQYAQTQTLESSVAWHRQQLARFHKFLSVVYSKETCLSCISRKPQYKFQCGHFICRTCVKEFYPRNDLDPWVILPDACHICGVMTQQLSIRLIPDTASVRVLSIDGGGIRGSAPIGFLKALQDEIRIPNYQVQRHFDIKLGTSSGALSVISLDVLGWDVDHCMNYFKTFAAKAFQCQCPTLVRILSKIPGLSTMVRWFNALHIMFVDRKYTADELEKLLQETCGMERTLSDCPVTTEIGTHIGVTLTDARNNNAFIVTNYNGVGERPSLCEYSILIPDDDEQEVPLWEILRCATAAPFYFKSRHLGNHGTFQDGGLAFNNPASIALRESAALYPDAADPSLLVSLGTGSSCSTPNEKSGIPPSWWSEMFPYRLFRSLGWHIDSQVAWKQLLGHRKADSRTEYFRFDISFEDMVPHLDEVAQMDYLGQMAYETTKGTSALRRLARRLRAELFFFELDASSPPRYANGSFMCAGHIMCRLRAGTPEYRAYMGQLQSEAAAFRLGNKILQFAHEDPDENFSQWVQFRVPNVKENFEISLFEGDDHLCAISGSPFSLEWLVYRQGIDMCLTWGAIEKVRSRECLSASPD